MWIEEPISFWGGVDPRDATLSDPRSAQHGVSLKGRVVAIADLRGSSSASSILLELIHNGCAPAALILDKVDAILAVGAIAARAMGWATLPILTLDRAQQALIPPGSWIDIKADGTLIVSEPKHAGA